MFKKIALIEKVDSGTQDMKLNYTGRAALLINAHHYDMKTKFLYMPGSYLDGSWVFSGYFICVLRILKDYFKSVLM